jgi:WD40 repeat protein
LAQSQIFLAFPIQGEYLVAMGAVERPEMAGGFTDFDAGHRDLVAVTKYNYYGNRLVTASLDHRMKIWDLKDGQWQLIDTWRAHDAEIRDVSDTPVGCELDHVLNSYRLHGTVLSQASILPALERICD